MQAGEIPATLLSCIFCVICSPITSLAVTFAFREDNSWTRLLFLICLLYFLFPPFSFSMSTFTIFFPVLSLVPHFFAESAYDTTVTFGVSSNVRPDSDWTAVTLFFLIPSPTTCNFFAFWGEGGDTEVRGRFFFFSRFSSIVRNIAAVSFLLLR